MDFDIPDLLQNQQVLQNLAWLIVALCIWTIASTLKHKRQRTHNIKALQNRVQALRDNALKPFKQEQKHISFIRLLMTKLNLVKSNPNGKTAALLAEAGFYSADAPYVLAFFRFILPTLFAVVGIIVMYWFHRPTNAASQMFNYTIAGLVAYIGFKLPEWYIRHKRKKRYRQIKKSLPDMLDLMTISVEAGLSLGAAIECIYGELGLAHPELAAELNITSAESKFLSDRNKALANWADRCKIPEVRGIVSVLIQTEKFGTPIVQALRVLSSEFRQERMLAAEQKAMRLPVQMTIPMMLCIMPTIVIIILAPAIMKLMDTFHQYVIQIHH